MSSSKTTASSSTAPSGGGGDARKLLKEVKKTQETLGKYIKTPTLSEKVLQRPPFRFLFDVIKSIVNETGYLSETFSPEELSATPQSSTTEWRRAFLNKLIIAAMESTGESTDVKPSRILSGVEPEKTNQLLQILAKGIQLEKDARAKAKSLGTGENQQQQQQQSKVQKGNTSASSKVGTSGQLNQTSINKTSTTSSTKTPSSLMKKNKDGKSGMNDTKRAMVEGQSRSPNLFKLQQSNDEKRKVNSNDSSESKNPSPKLTQDNSTHHQPTTQPLQSITTTTKSHGDVHPAAARASGKSQEEKFRSSKSNEPFNGSSSGLSRNMKPPGETAIANPQGPLTRTSSCDILSSTLYSAIHQETEEDEDNNHLEDDDDDDDDDDRPSPDYNHISVSNGKKWISPTNPNHYHHNQIPNSMELETPQGPIPPIAHERQMTSETKKGIPSGKSECIYIEITGDECPFQETESDKAESVVDETEEQLDSQMKSFQENLSNEPATTRDQYHQQQQQLISTDASDVASSESTVDDDGPRLNSSLCKSNSNTCVVSFTQFGSYGESQRRSSVDPSSLIIIPPPTPIADVGGTHHESDCARSISSKANPPEYYYGDPSDVNGNADDNWVPFASSQRPSSPRRPASSLDEHNHHHHYDEQGDTSTSQMKAFSNAPPHSIDSHFFESVHDDYRPPQGMVSNVILECGSGGGGSSNSSSDEEQEFQAHEQVHGGSDARNKNGFSCDKVGSSYEDEETSLPPQDQRGYLVNQILSTQRELEESTKTTESCSLKRGGYQERLAYKGEIERLMEMVQTTARKAGPLTKLLDLSYQDVLLMGDEFRRWKSERQKLETQVDRLLTKSDEVLRPLKSELGEIESQILETQSCIHLSKLNIHRMERKIEEHVGKVEEPVIPCILPPPLRAMRRKFLLDLGVQLKDEDKDEVKDEDKDEEEPEKEKPAAAAVVVGGGYLRDEKTEGISDDDEAVNMVLLTLK